MPQNCKGLQSDGLLGFVFARLHLDNVPLKTPLLGWVSFLLVTFPLKCLVF